MRLIVLSLVVVVGWAYAGDGDAAALTARIHELKAKLNDAEKRIANADNDDVRAQAKRQAEELRGAIERAAQELKAAQRPEGAREKPVQKPEGMREKPAPKPEAREGGGLEKMVDRIAELRKRALAAKREGRADQARDMWLEAERLDQALKREMGDAPRPPREGPPRDAPPPEALERAFNAAREALAGKRWEAAEGALRHAVEILAGMVRRPELGPEDARWCRGQIERLMGGAAAFREAGRMDMAEFLQGAAKRLMGALDRARPGGERPGAPGAELERHLAELSQEHENLGRRMEELEGARREIAQNIERRENAVRQVEGEKREALKRELQSAIEKLERVTAESNEVRAHAKKIDAERDRIAAELRNVRREGDREGPRAERPVRRDGDVERERPVRRDGDVERERPDEARAEIEALRAEVKELRRLLKEALKRD